ncbi:MAG: tetratricopeptide repeat protein [Magnetococcales bacterium]|nr:tetratricopeptide repeat protein [Magnetococcales bacterium]
MSDQQVSIEQAFQWAVRHHQNGALEPAEALYRQIIEAMPNHLHAIHNLSILLRASGRLEGAVELLKRVVALKPEVAEYHNTLGVVLGDLGQLELAEAAFGQAVSLNPKDAQAHFNQGVYRRAQGALEGALTSFERVLELRPDDLEARLQRGLVCQGLERMDVAREDIEAVLAQHPEHVEALTSLGTLHHLQGDLEQAEKCHRQALKSDPNALESQRNLGLICHAQQRTEEAEACFQRVAELAPNDVGSRLELGRMLILEGRFQEALGPLRRVVTLAPQMKEAWQLLAVVVSVISFPTLDESMLIDLLRLLAQPSVDPSTLSRSIYGTLAYDDELAPLLTAMEKEGVLPEDLDLDALLEKLACNPLLTRMLTLTALENQPLEGLFNHLRRLLLGRVEQGWMGEASGLPFLVALAIQAHIQGHPNPPGSEEQVILAWMQNEMAKRLDNSGEIPPTWLTVLAIYGAMNDLPMLDDLRRQSWPESLTPLWSQQLGEVPMVSEQVH